MKKEILYIGLDVHAENIAVARASVIPSAVSVSTALRGLPPPNLPDTSPAPCPSLTPRKLGYHAERSKTLRDFRAQSARSVCGSSGKGRAHEGETSSNWEPTPKMFT